MKSRFDYDRWCKFELDTRYLIHSMNEPVTKEDFLEVDEIKHALIVLGSKDAFGEKDEILINNTVHDCYEAMKKLECSHNEVKDKISCIRSFIEDFYLNPNQNDDER